MESTDVEFLKAFYQALDDRPLDPVVDKALYEPLYAKNSSAPSDPVNELQTTIEWEAVQSAQLFSGFRGTGKSTELHRLKRQLEKNGSVVVLCDMRDYLNLSTELDVSDFLLAAAGAFGDELAKDPVMSGQDVIREGYWTRFCNFLTRTQIEVSALGLSAGTPALKAELKLNLREDPTFRQRLQDRLKGHLGALVKDVHGFFGECITAIRKAHSDDSQRVVMLLDSVEQIEGTSVNAPKVADSLEIVFRAHSNALKIPYLHVVYTVPPWLKIKAPGVAGLYREAQLIPCVKVRHEHGEKCQAGLDELERIVARRGDWRRLLGDDRAALDELLLASGGYLRDLFRILQTVLRLARHERLPASPAIRALALDDVRNSYLPIANDDARWLCRVDESHTTQLDDQEKLRDLARFYNNHLVLTYRNGHEWVGVHPLIVKQVKRQIAELDETAERQSAAGTPS
ncbi:hypothetical protein [Nannocystis punicea]|uniref:AAA ATPase domain-containing protein n=1 Tax=Nannocystis punicea TaxID=2995304 RepID=A0ABY7HCE0_9BACT|nr:hypothetical protein [Nannocystis poenicansa]WAS96937.1 hypothetical protein O0S08_12375 [Nannocystis poenicansa]